MNWAWAVFLREGVGLGEWVARWGRVEEEEEGERARMRLGVYAYCPRDIRARRLVRFLA